MNREKTGFAKGPSKGAFLLMRELESGLCVNLKMWVLISIDLRELTPRHLIPP